MTDYSQSQAWTDLAEAIPLLAKHATGPFPFHCEHDELTVMSAPSEYSLDELDRLEKLGFDVNEDYNTFYSLRYGSA